MISAPHLMAPHHLIADFDSGEQSLDDWLKRRALANQANGASRCYAVTDRDGAVVGFYAISSGILSLAAAPSKLKRNMPDPIPMALIGRLAVSRAHQGKGIGRALLQDAVLRIRAAADILGIRGVMVHAISDRAEKFYLDHGFTAVPGQERLLVLSIL